MSSTNVTLTFSGASRTQPARAAALAAGVMAACKVLFVRVAVAVAVLNLSLLPVLLPYVVAPFLVGLVASAVGMRQQREAEADLIISENPLQIGAAVRMTVPFQTVMFVVYAVNRQFGDAGVIATGAALGLTARPSV